MNDPFGQAFIDYFNGDKSAEIIIHCNKGDDDIVPVSYFFRDIDIMPKTEIIALENCSGKILDIGAGSGSHSLELLKRGHEVTSLDINPVFVKIMKMRGLNNVILSDIFNYSGSTYDTLLMLMNGVGFTRDFDGLHRFLGQARSLLNNGGQIILDSSDLLYLYQDEDGEAVINLNDSYYGEVEFIVEYKGVIGEPFSWLYTDFGNLSSIANDAGFKVDKLFEDDHYNYLARLY